MTGAFVYFADYNTPFIDNPEIDLYNCNKDFLCIVREGERVEASLREQMRWVFKMIARALATGMITFQDDPRLYALYFESIEIRDLVRVFAEEARLLIREDAEAIYFFCAEESPFTMKKVDFFKQIPFPSKRWQLFEVLTAILFLMFFEENAEYVVLSEILERIRKLVAGAKLRWADPSPRKESGAVPERWISDWEGLSEGFIRPGDWTSYKSDSQVGLIVKAVQVLNEQGLVTYFEKQRTIVPTAKARAVYGMWKEEDAWVDLGIKEAGDA